MSRRPVRRQSFSENEIKQSLDNPDIRKIKDELKNMAEMLRQEDTPSEDQADDLHMQRRNPQTRGRGPIGNRNQESRVQATTDRTDRILKSLAQERGADFSRFIKNKDDTVTDEEDYDHEEDSLPPPRPRPAGPGMAPPDKGLLTNRDIGVPRPGMRPGRDDRLSAPELSRLQKLELELETLKKDQEKREMGIRVPTDKPKIGNLRFARKPSQSLEGFQKVDLQSDFLFYDFGRDDFQLRPIDAPTQILITNAKTANDGEGDESLLYDALQNCTAPGIDLRSLTFPDMYYVLMWFQFNSYPNVPFDIDWISKYGNKNKFTLEEHNLRYLRVGANREDVARWRALGLDYPRVRDREILKSDLEKEDVEIYRRAQHFAGNTPEEKVEQFYAASAEVLAEYPRMLEACNHGIFDHIDLVDQYYNPKAHADKLLASAQSMEIDAEKYKEDPIFYLSLMAEVEGLRAKANEILQSLKNGERVEPDAERVTLVFRPLAFFPVL